MAGQPWRPTLADGPRKKALVVSHERSGTHFLMNTLEANFGYVARPWLNLDFEQGLNFHAPQALRQFFGRMRDRPMLNIGKSHHAAGFFADCLDDLLGQFHVLYIHRDPRDVMLSHWRYVRALAWDEGPKTATPGAFLRAAPRGAMLRYQKEQAVTILHRWTAHVEGWAFALPERVRERIVYVRYEDLNLRFEDTVRQLGRRLAQPVDSPIRPDRTRNVVVPGTGEVGGHRGALSADDLEFVRNVAGATMQRLGIPWGAPPSPAIESDPPDPRAAARHPIPPVFTVVVSAGHTASAGSAVAPSRPAVQAQAVPAQAVQAQADAG